MQTIYDPRKLAVLLQTGVSAQAAWKHAGEIIKQGLRENLTRQRILADVRANGFRECTMSYISHAIQASEENLIRGAGVFAQYVANRTNLEVQHPQIAEQIDLTNSRVVENVSRSLHYTDLLLTKYTQEQLNRVRGRGEMLEIPEGSYSKYVLFRDLFLSHKPETAVVYNATRPWAKLTDGPHAGELQPSEAVILREASIPTTVVDNKDFDLYEPPTIAKKVEGALLDIPRTEKDVLHYINLNGGLDSWAFVNECYLSKIFSKQPNSTVAAVLTASVPLPSSPKAKFYKFKDFHSITGELLTMYIGVFK